MHPHTHIISIRFYAKCPLLCVTRARQTVGLSIGLLPIRGRNSRCSYERRRIKSGNGAILHGDGAPVRHCRARYVSGKAKFADDKKPIVRQCRRNVLSGVKRSADCRGAKMYGNAKFAGPPVSRVYGDNITYASYYRPSKFNISRRRPSTYGTVFIVRRA